MKYCQSTMRVSRYHLLAMKPQIDDDVYVCICEYCWFTTIKRSDKVTIEKAISHIREREKEREEGINKNNG